jgi:hypothetical protein
MNENNVDYLIKQVKFTGFGDSLEFPIKENIAKGLEDFQLSYKPDFGKDKVDATLHFRKSEQGNYFFNKYDLAVAQENGEPLQRSFGVTGSKQILMRDKEGHVMQDNEGKERKEWVNSSYTLKEAFNVMEGRSVLKDHIAKKKDPQEIDRKVTQWTKLDFSSKDKYGNYEIKYMPAYDMENKLAGYPIKNFKDDPAVRKEIVDSLEKGNRQVVTLVGHNGKEEKRGLEANPQFKTVNQYDGSQRIKNQSEKQGATIAEGQAEKEGQSSAKKNSVKNTGDGQDEPAPEQQQQRRNKKKQGVS